MYNESGGELIRPDKVASPANGASLLIRMGLNVAAALISIIFLIGIHQRNNKMMKRLTHLCLTHFHQ